MKYIYIIIYNNIIYIIEYILILIIAIYLNLLSNNNRLIYIYIKDEG